MTTGKLEGMLESYFDSVCSSAFLADGTHIVSGSKDESVQIWNTNTGTIEDILKEHPGPVTSVVLSPDGRSIMSASFC